MARPWRPGGAFGRRTCSCEMLRFHEWIVFTALGGCLVPAATAAQAPSAAKGKRMTASEFDHLFKTKDWTAVEISQQTGPPMVPYVEPYLSNQDELIRLLAVDCIAAAGGPRAPELLIKALRDKNEQVRINAVNALHKQLPVGRGAELMAAFTMDQTRDAYVRQQIPMILGRMQAREFLAPLKARIADSRQDVKDGIIAGASKMGDGDARSAFGEMLRAARGQLTAELIEYVKYLDEPWVIPLLVPALQRRDLAVDLSTHRTEVRRRDCDLAVDEVMRISNVRFSFAMNPLAQYTEPQVNEVLRYAQAQPR